MNQENNNKKTADVFICGDILNKNKEDGLICSEELSKMISSADFSVCNFEAPIEGFGKPAAKPGVHHNQKITTISGLKQQGFQLLLLANNHLLDYGKPALEATLKKARENNLDTLGAGLNAADAYLPLVKKINGLTIGMLNACEAQYGEIGIEEEKNKAGYAWINHPTLENNIIKLKHECDFVLVFVHAGLEHYPIPQKEWRTKYRHFCDLGADAVIGSHPHVPQGFERYGKSIIFYSLGNFFIDIKNNENNSFAIMLNLTKGKEPGLEIIHHYTKEGRVHLAPKEKYINVDELNALLNSDKYWKEHEIMTREAFRKIKRSLAISVFLPVPLSGKFNDFFRLLASVVIRRNKIKYKDLYQLHLLKNETYYYVIKNAMELKTRNYNPIEK
jgi:hypothetical protein